MSNKKLQKGGRDSTNIQAENINIGITYGDAKKIADDVFKANFLKLTGMAEKVAHERAFALIEKFLEELRLRSPDSVRSFQDPDMQYDLFIAQRDFARSGTQSLSEMLVDLLVERAKANESSILQIVLNEAIATVPKLLPVHLDTLSVTFLIKYTQIQGIKEVLELQDYIKWYIPFVENISANSTVYQHLEYADCAVVSHEQGITMMPSPLSGFWKNRYSGLFSKGFSESELTEVLPPDSPQSQLPLIKCKRNSDKLQFDVVNSDELRKLKLDPSTTQRLVELHNKHLVDNDEVAKLFISWTPEIEKLLNIWHRSTLHRMNLTSVGIAIGHANVRRRTEQEFDLSHWLS